MNITIHPFPAPSDSNMFLKLLYNQVDGKSFDGIEFKVEPCSLRTLVAQGKPNQADKHIVHLHWEPVLYGSRFVLKSVALMAVNFFMLAVLQKFYGMKIVWTLHNYRSHDYPHPFLDRMGQRMVFAFADAIIIQQKSVADSWQAKYPRKHIVYIPLGNYIGAYPESSMDRNEVRGHFGLNPDDIIVLSFGTAKPYKKIENIIKVFKEVHGDPRLKLCIVGSAKKQYAQHLCSLIGDNPSIIFKNEFTKDKDVAGVLEMADYSVFWYDDSVLTSAGVNLSLSYGLPVIVRDIAAAERVRDGVNGFLFDGVAQLAQILRELPNTERMPKEAIIHSIAGDDWGTLARSFMKLCGALYNA